jgi:hypothetical protein
MTEAELLADIPVKNPEIQKVGTPQKMEKEHASLPDVRYMFVLAFSVDADGISQRHKIIYYVKEEWDNTDPENPQLTSQEAFYKDKQPAPKPVKDSGLVALENGIKALSKYIEHKITFFDKEAKYAEFELIREVAAGQCERLNMSAKKVNGNPITFWEFV